MASSSKKKTTMAKMNRESAVRDRRLRKQAKKDARKLAPAESQAPEAPEAPFDPAAALPTDAKLDADGVPVPRGSQ